jgi:hypothetical protein
MVTAELAACLPVLALVVVVALSAISIAGQQVRAQDAASEVARASARGDSAAAGRLFADTAPRAAALSVVTAGGNVTATVRVTLHPLGGWLGSYTVVERSVALVEPPAYGAVTSPAAAVTSPAGAMTSPP